MKNAVSVGVSISEFWDLTPFELSFYFIAYSEKTIRDYNFNVEMAYLNAYFKRVEKMPALADFLFELDGTPKKKLDKKQSAVSMLEEVKKLNVAMGGNVY